MEIAMIGAGAMGSLFGALLVEAGERVTLIDIRKEYVDAINTNGLIIEDDDRRRIVRMKATTTRIKLVLWTLKWFKRNGHLAFCNSIFT